MSLIRLLAALSLVVLLGACPPTLRNEPIPVDDDDDATSDDDDAANDVCCEADGGPGTWEDCENREAIECVCDIDAFCCGDGWDGSCSDLYVSPCGALCE